MMCSRICTLPMAERPGFSDALGACLEHGAGVLLVEERTRLARDKFAAHDALRTFAHAGVQVLCADGSNANGATDPAAMLLDGIGHAVAASDRRVIVARMAAGRQAKAQRDPRSRAQGGSCPTAIDAVAREASRLILRLRRRCGLRSTSCVVELLSEPQRLSLAGSRRCSRVSSSVLNTSALATGGLSIPASGTRSRLRWRDGGSARELSGRPQTHGGTLV